MREKKVPLRKCIGCNERYEKKNILRIVKNENQLFIDETGKKNGRGAYICDNINCFEKIKKNKILSKTFSINVDDDFIFEIKEILDARKR